MADPPVTIEVKGVREFKSGTRRLAAKIDDGADAAFRSVADQTAMMVRGRVPKLSGRLASAVAGQSGPHGATVGYQDLVYSGPVDYGGWPPGRTYIPEGRYLYPTALEARDMLRRAGETAADHEIRSFIWPRPTAL